MNYSALLKGLICEAKTFKQYRRLPLLICILAVIGVLPFIICSLFLLLAYGIYGFFFNAIFSTANYLEGWLHNERKGLRHGTEAVLYFCAIPTIFTLHVFLAFFACIYYFLWFFLQCVGYVATLGGIRFQSNINTAVYGSVESGYTMRGRGVALNVVAAIAFGLFALWGVFMLIWLITEDNDIRNIADIIDIVYTLFAAISIPLCAKKSFAGNLDGADDIDLPVDDETGDLELPEV